MGKIINTTGYLVQSSRAWNSTWYSKKDRYGSFIIQDYFIRKYLKKKIKINRRRTFDAYLSQIQIERNITSISLHVSGYDSNRTSNIGKFYRYNKLQLLRTLHRKLPKSIQKYTHRKQHVFGLSLLGVERRLSFLYLLHTSLCRYYSYLRRKLRFIHRLYKKSTFFLSGTNILRFYQIPIFKKTIENKLKKTLHKRKRKALLKGETSLRVGKKKLYRNLYDILFRKQRNTRYKIQYIPLGVRVSTIEFLSRKKILLFF